MSSSAAFLMTHNQVTENSEAHTWLKKLNMVSRKTECPRYFFFDLSKAFDKVWKEGLLCKLSKCGVKGKMLTWIRDYLTRRCARVKANNTISNLVQLHEGVPQGGGGGGHVSNTLLPVLQ